MYQRNAFCWHNTNGFSLLAKYQRIESVGIITTENPLVYWISFHSQLPLSLLLIRWKVTNGIHILLGKLYQRGFSQQFFSLVIRLAFHFSNGISCLPTENSVGNPEFSCSEYYLLLSSQLFTSEERG